VGVSHRADHGETIASVWHVQVGKQNIKTLCGDAAKGIPHSRDCDHVEPTAFQCCPQHVAYSVIILCQ
jgi:hypothetical protein